MFSHIILSPGPQIDFFLNDLDNRGRRLDVFTTTTGVGSTYRVGIYPYDFSFPKTLKKVYITTRISQLISLTRRAGTVRERLTTNSQGDSH